MKILFLGEIGSGQTALMRMRAFERLGNSVRGVNPMEPWKRVPWLKRQLQRRPQGGSVVAEINHFVLERAAISSDRGLGGETGVSSRGNDRGPAELERETFTLHPTRISRSTGSVRG